MIFMGKYPNTYILGLFPINFALAIINNIFNLIKCVCIKLIIKLLINDYIFKLNNIILYYIVLSFNFTK